MKMVFYLRFLWVKICLISSLKTNTFAFANSFWIIVFFKKLSRNFPLIRSLFTYQFADCFIKFIWLNFYTMKFSRFRFSVLLNVIILTQPVNIVKRFFLFHQVFIKSMENFRRCCFATAWLLYQTAYALSRTFLNFFSNFFFPADPLPRGCERKARLLSSDSLSILPPLLPFVKYPFRVFRRNLGLLRPQSCPVLALL